MTTRQHEIPTHLNVEDKVLFGLTMRQFLYILVGCSTAYGLWEQALDAPSAVRVAISGLCLVLAVALALLCPFGRPLEEWLLAGLLYFAAPRSSCWRQRDPDPTDWRPASGAWQELAPNLVWADEEIRR
ncbi:MAG TPA: PrgI family protein [Chloroflexota bacterium]